MECVFLSFQHFSNQVPVSVKLSSPYCSISVTNESTDFLRNFISNRIKSNYSLSKHVILKLTYGQTFPEVSWNKEIDCAKWGCKRKGVEGENQQVMSDLGLDFLSYHFADIQRDMKAYGKLSQEPV